MEEEKKEEKSLLDKTKEKVEEKIEEIINEDIHPSNVDYLYKLVDIHKDIENEKYWKEKINMMYGNEYGRRYGNYEGGRSRDSMGRYTDGNYGRRGYDARYRGEDALDEMKYHYGNYQDSYNTGNYGAKEDSAYKMTEAFKKFAFSVGEELEPQEKQMFKQAMQEVMMKMDK